MTFKITCECGYTDDALNFISISNERKGKGLRNGEEVIIHLFDKTFKCPNCGRTKTTTQSHGFSFVVPDVEEEEEF